MESKKAILKTIRRLKEIKDENGLTYTQIREKVENKGYYVSEATIKRVFSPGAEERHFRYQDSIAPLAEVLFDEYGDTSEDADAATLRQIIKDRDKTIEQLLIKIENQETTSSQLEKLYADRKASYEASIQKLTEQIDRKDSMLEKLLSALLESGKIEQTGG